MEVQLLRRKSSDYREQVNEYQTEDGKYGIISAVTILAHEIDHAAENERLAGIGDKTRNYKKLIAFQAALSAAPTDNRRTKEEKRAVRGLERKIALLLGQHVRNSHNEKPVDRFISSSPLKEF